MDFLETSLYASILIVVVVLLRTLALHKLPKKTFVVLWGIVVLRLLIPLPIPSRFSLYTGITMLERALAENYEAFPVTTVTGIPSMENAAGTGGTANPSSVVGFSPLEIVWLIGMCACALFFIVTYVKCIKRFNMSLPVKNEIVTRWLEQNPLMRPVQIRQSDRIQAPLTYGVFRPVVLFPRSIDWADEKKLRYILTHEFTHIRHFDTLFKLVMTLAVCVHWFNPLVWVMYVVANRDMELCCDETVLRSLGQNTKASYALTLLELEKVKGCAPFANHFSKNAIEERMVSIMKTKKMSLSAIVVAVLLVVTTSTVFATNALAADIEKEENVRFAEKITDFDDKDVQFTVNPSAASFASYKGTVINEQENAADFDAEKAIADIEAGIIKPLTMSNLPNGIAKDAALKFVGQDTKTFEVNLNSISVHANCAHEYTPGVLGVHSKSSDGSCTYATYDAIRCYKCNTIWVLDLISSTDYRVCPH